MNNTHVLRAVEMRAAASLELEDGQEEPDRHAEVDVVGMLTGTTNTKADEYFELYRKLVLHYSIQKGQEGVLWLPADATVKEP